MHIYIYIERERESELLAGRLQGLRRDCFIYIYIYIYRERERELFTLPTVIYDSTINSCIIIILIMNISVRRPLRPISLLTLWTSAGLIQAWS